MLLHLIILFLTSHIAHPQRATKSVRLSHSNTYQDGAGLMINFNEVKTINNEWQVNVLSQDKWHFVIFLDNTFGFDENYDSSVKITVNTNNRNWYPGNELLFGFTSQNREYVSFLIPMSVEVNSYVPNQIYPSCSHSQFGGSSQLFASGDVSSMAQRDRMCDIAAGSCANWKNMIPPNTGFPPLSQFSFILENHPNSGTLDIKLDSSSFPPGFIQTCTFGQTFSTNTRGLKIYIAGNDPGTQYSISSFDIQSAVLTPTHDPTIPPTMKPTNNPIKPPTYNPTYNPIKSPTNNPNKPPTNNPTNNPIKPPTYTPTLRTFDPTIRPSYAPSIGTINPSISPTNNPTTRGPTKPPLPNGYQWGTYNQLCPLNSATKQCRFIGDKIVSHNNVLCQQEYDCCMCETIACGFGTAPCQSLQVGTNGIFGVKDVQIIGNAQGVNGVIIVCQGDDACKMSNIDATNVNSIDCIGERSCAGANINVNNPKENFMLNCAGYASCNGLTIDISLPAPPAGFKCNPFMTKDIINMNKISCKNEYACKGLKILINNRGCDQLIINDLECLALGSCSDSIFSISGDVKINKCHCGSSCNSAIGLEEYCFGDLDAMRCLDEYSCQSQIKTITNPLNHFEFFCSNIGACKNAHFVIKLNSGQVTNLGAFLMGGIDSARGATFVFENTQGFDVRINKIECQAEGSCRDCTFIVGDNVFIDSFDCVTNACHGCRIQQIGFTGSLPCDATQI